MVVVAADSSGVVAEPWWWLGSGVRVVGGGQGQRWEGLLERRERELI